MGKVIAFVAKDFPAGGTERVFLNLAAAFSSQGYEIHIMLLSNRGEWIQTIPRRFRVHLLGSEGKRLYFGLFRRSIALRRCLGRLRPVLCISGKEQANLALFFASIFSRELFPVYTRHVPISPDLSTDASIVTKWLYATYAIGRGAIVAVSQDIAAAISKVPFVKTEKVVAIKNPVITPALLAKIAAPTPETFRDMPYIVASGRLVTQKGMDILISAFPYVLERFPHLKLVIVGDGPKRTDLEEQVRLRRCQSSVMFAGFQENPFPIIKAAKVFVLPSRYEGLPTALIEALFMGVPIVSADCPTGPREILEGGRYGYLVPTESPADLAEGIVNALEEPITDRPSFRPYTLEVAAELYLGLRCDESA